MRTADGLALGSTLAHEPMEATIAASEQWHSSPYCYPRLLHHSVHRQAMWKLVRRLRRSRKVFEEIYLTPNVSHEVIAFGG